VGEMRDRKEKRWRYEDSEAVCFGSKVIAVK
jgi:hypothetical protein